MPFAYLLSAEPPCLNQLCGAYVERYPELPTPLYAPTASAVSLSGLVPPIAIVRPSHRPRIFSRCRAFLA